MNTQMMNNLCNHVIPSYHWSCSGYSVTEFTLAGKCSFPPSEKYLLLYVLHGSGGFYLGDQYISVKPGLLIGKHCDDSLRYAPLKTTAPSPEIFQLKLSREVLFSFLCDPIHCAVPAAFSMDSFSLYVPSHLQSYCQSHFQKLLEPPSMLQEGLAFWKACVLSDLFSTTDLLLCSNAAQNSPEVSVSADQIAVSPRNPFPKRNVGRGLRRLSRRAAKWILRI